jgi:cation diffusion facilitator CzcD-associated flavoprotein CzcO
VLPATSSSITVPQILLVTSLRLRLDTCTHHAWPRTIPINMTEHIRVAVIGLGAAGLVALKNLKEEGFDVTGFERNAYIGGLWKFSEDDKTSVLSTTVVNISKERVWLSGFRINDYAKASQGCYTDFPFPECKYSSHATALIPLTFNSCTVICYGRPGLRVPHQLCCAF